MTDKEYISYALSLAEKGIGYVNPNPLVGAVIVKNNKIIGQGYHQEYGKLHAERNAIADCKEDLKGATMYVTLEPCCHYGKTPPCTDAIIKSGIKKVVIGSLDPNILVAGKGAKILESAGIEVETGLLCDECQKQNEVFFHYIKTKTPFVVMKYAMTIDGKIATSSGESKWITSEKARIKVHQDRHRYSAIMVGVGTVFADNPMLTCRISGGKNPIRIICDTNLKLPIDCNLVKTSKDVRTIIATCNKNPSEHEPFLSSGCEVLNVSKQDGHINLKQLMTLLGKMEIDSILLEGGSTLNFSALKSKIINKVQTYIAPKIFGGIKAKTPVGGDGFSKIIESVKLKNQSVSYLGNDILIESEVDYKCSQE